MRFSLISM